MAFEYLLSHPSVFILLLAFTIIAIILMFWKRTTKLQIQSDINIIIDPAYLESELANNRNHSRSDSYEYLPSRDTGNNNESAGPNDRLLSNHGPSLNNAEEVAIRKCTARNVNKLSPNQKDDEFSSRTYISMAEFDHFDHLGDDNVMRLTVNFNGTPENSYLEPVESTYANLEQLKN